MKAATIASALLALLFAATASQAQTSNGSGTTFLHCVDPAAPTAPIDVTIDFSHNTANNLPATINATAIDWARHGDNGAFTVQQDYHIDRTTGTLTLRDTVSSGGRLLPGSNNPLTSNYQCSVASAPATKF